MAAKSRTAAPRRGRPSKKKTAQTELNRSWSILLFGLAGVLFALTYIRGAAAWNAVAGWLFGLFGVITYAVAPVTASLVRLESSLLTRCTSAPRAILGPSRPVQSSPGCTRWARQRLAPLRDRRGTEVVPKDPAQPKRISRSPT